MYARAVARLVHNFSHKVFSLHRATGICTYTRLRQPYASLPDVALAARLCRLHSAMSPLGGGGMLPRRRNGLFVGRALAFSSSNMQ